MTKYEKLKNYLEKVTDLEYLSTLIAWEMRISGACNSKDYLIEVRTRLEGQRFELITSDKFGEILFNLINSSEMKELSEAEQIILLIYQLDIIILKDTK